MTAHINEPRFVAFPREMVTGVLSDAADPDSVAAALVATGVPQGNVRFLQGEEGLAILNPEGDRGTLSQRLRRKVEHFLTEGAVLERVAAALRAGKTVVGIFDVKKGDADRIRDACTSAGVVDLHYFGRIAVD